MPKTGLTAFRLQALSGDNGADSAAPSVTDPGEQEDPASVLDAIGEIASGRMAKAEVSLCQVMSTSIGVATFIMSSA